MPAPYSTLQDIYNKIRRLTRSPSANQISNDELNNYVNIFLLYDLPSALKLFELKKRFSFYTTPYVDVYPIGTNEENLVTNPFYDFKNKNITISEPIYISGKEALYYQSMAQFNMLYSEPKYNQEIGLGDGIISNYTGTLAQTIVRNKVSFTAFDVNNNGMVLHDVPILNNASFPTFGNLVKPNEVATGIYDATNFINYISGAYSVTFASAPQANSSVKALTVGVEPSLPTAVFFFDGHFTLRPVPDAVYEVSMEVRVQPTELLSTNLNAEPYLQQWAEYIAYGAARKIFQDRMDIESLQIVEPEFRAQERYVLRRTICQQSSQRTATIFSDGLNPNRIRWSMDKF
jgi:hypothetical protein